MGQQRLIRFLKVRSGNRETAHGWKYFPKITIEGDWLENFGFESGNLITVRFKRRKLIISRRNKKDLISINRDALDLTNVKADSGDVVYPYFSGIGTVKKEMIKVAKEGELYRVTSIPFRAPGIALNDLIEVEEKLGFLFFKAIAQKSGNSTVHLQLWDRYWEKPLLLYLESLGCTWIRRVSGKITINVPPAAPRSELLEFLDSGNAPHRWQYQTTELLD